MKRFFPCILGGIAILAVGAQATSQENPCRNLTPIVNPSTPESCVAICAAERSRPHIVNVHNRCSEPVYVTIRNAFGSVPFYMTHVEPRSFEKMSLEKGIRYRADAKFVLN